MKDEPKVTWRGSVTDLATDVAYLLTAAQGLELSRELERFTSERPDKFASFGNADLTTEQLADAGLRLRVCSVDTCVMCDARPGEVCRSVFNGGPLTWLHLQPVDDDAEGEAVD